MATYPPDDDLVQDRSISNSIAIEMIRIHYALMW